MTILISLLLILQTEIKLPGKSTENLVEVGELWVTATKL